MQRSLKKEWSVFFAIGLGVFIVNLDGSLLAVAFPVLQKHFEVDTQVLQWVITAYFLVITSILPIIGKLSDLWGRKWVYITGASLFSIASILCGISESVEQMITFRIIQGLGGSMIMANAMSIITIVFPQSKRGIALGGITSITAIAAIIGPAVGGFLISEYSWRSVFWIHSPIAAVSIIFTSILLKAKTQKRPESIKIDYVGAIIFAMAMVSLLLFISNGNTWGWLGWVSLTSLLFSITAWILFGRWELHHKKPIINVELFKNPLFTYGNMAACFSFIILTLPSILLPLYLSNYFSIPIEEIGYMLSTQAISMILFSLVSGWITDRVNPFLPAIIGMILSIFGFVGLYFLTKDSGRVEIIVSLAFLGAGIGFFQSPSNVLTLKKIPEQQTGLANGIMATMRNFGRVTGSAVAILLYHSLSNLSLSVGVIIGGLLCVFTIIIMLISHNYVKVQSKREDHEVVQLRG